MFAKYKIGLWLSWLWVIFAISAFFFYPMPVIYFALLLTFIQFVIYIRDWLADL